MKRGRKRSDLSHCKKMDRCVAKLPDDLTVEILSRLPAKSFFRFQCVSRSLLALSSDPYYQNKFPRASSGLFFNICFGFILRARRGIQYISLPRRGKNFAMDTTLSFLPDTSNVEVISACNGLLLCCSWVERSHLISPIPDGVKAQSYVCNPATREWVVVPQAKDGYDFNYLALGFDPRISRHYHILRFDFDEDKVLRLMIFSTKTNEWVVSEVSKAKECRRPRATFFRGIFYVTNGLNHVFGVDPEGKICRRIELPESDWIERLGHSGGYLHYILQSKDEIKVWMLKDDCRVEWVLKHCINIRAMLQKRRKPETQDICILEFHPDEDVVFLRIGREVFSYHLNRGKFRKICDWDDKYSCVVYSPCLSKGFGDEVA